MLAMTSIAVTASIFASASEAALFLASFTSNSLDLGISHRGRKARWLTVLYSEHPTDEDSLTESPLCEYRLSQGRTVIRRQFDSGVLLLGHPVATVWQHSVLPKTKLNVGKPS